MQDDGKLSHVLKKFAKGSILVFIGVFLSKIISYLYRVIMARNFGQEVYGLFSLAVSILSLCIAVFSLGLPSGLLRYISLYKGKGEVNHIRSILRFSLFFILIASLIGGALLFFFSEAISLNFFHTPNLTPFLQWFAVFLPVSILAGAIHGIILAYEKIGWFSFIGNILFPLSQLISLVAFIFIGLNSEAISFSYNIGFVIMLISSFLVCKHSIKEIFGKPNLEKKEKLSADKKLFSYSWPIIFSGVINLFFSGIDSFTIGYLKNPSEVGIYNAAVPLSYFLLIVPSLFLLLFLPIVTKEYAKGNNVLIKEISRKIGRWIFILNLPILIIIVLFPGAVISIFFGAEYLGAESSLRFLAVGLFFYAIFQISENLLSMAGKSRVVLSNIIVSSVFNLALNFVLIPTYGISGAAFSTMLSYMLWGVLSLISAKHYAFITPLSSKMLKVFFSAGIPAIVLFYIRKIVPINLFTMALMVLLFLIFYFFLLWKTKCFDENDGEILKMIKNKFMPSPVLD